MATSLFLFLNHTVMTLNCNLNLALTRSRAGYWSHLLCSAVTTVCLLGLTAGRRSDAERMWNSRSALCSDLVRNHHLKLQATPGDRLTLNFKQATLNADGSKPSQPAVCQPGSCDATLPTPAVKEQVVLSTHRSFELLKILPSSGVRTELRSSSQSTGKSGQTGSLQHFFTAILAIAEFTSWW